MPHIVAFGNLWNKIWVLLLSTLNSGASLKWMKIVYIASFNSDISRLLILLILPCIDPYSRIKEAWILDNLNNFFYDLKNTFLQS